MKVKTGWTLPTFNDATQRLVNGDTFLAPGYHDRLFEDNPAGKMVWDFSSPIARPSLRQPTAAVKAILRAYAYPPPSSTGLPGQNVKPQGKLTTAA